MHTSRDEPTLLIRHWRSEYLVPDSHPLPAKVRERLDSAVSKDVPSVLAAQLQRTLRGADDELIFVRRLHLDFAVDTGWDSDAIAAQCAQALTGRLARELSIGDASNVMRFSSRAEYLARFLVDRASGDAGSRWYYARFTGLHPLPCAAALRTALLEDIGLGFTALRLLDEHDLTGVIAALGDIECRRIVDACAASLPSGDDARAFATFIPLAYTPTPGGVTTASQLALWWLARTHSPLDRSSTTAALTIARVVAALRAGVDRRAMLSSALLDENADAIAALARDDVETYVRLRTCPPELLRQLLADRKDPQPENESLGGTSFGGPFVLLDDLFALPIDDATHAWPALHSVPAATVLRFLILCHCVGTARIDAMFNDALWRRLFSIAPTIGRYDIARWLASLGPRCRRHYRNAIAGEDHSCSVCGVTHTYRVRMDEDGLWQTLCHAPSDAKPSNEEEAASLDEDVAYFLAPDKTPRGWSLPIALSAQRVMRRFLRRLPGFATSHPPYAYRNLIEFSASVDAQAERIVVLLGRPPLGMILNFSGSNRGMRRWPALDARPFALFNGS